MTRNEAEDEIRQLMTHLRMTNRQIEAFGVLLWDTSEMKDEIGPPIMIPREEAERIRESFLRDEFAGRALTGLVAREVVGEKSAARSAYYYAEAMLNERKRAHDLA